MEKQKADDSHSEVPDFYVVRAMSSTVTPDTVRSRLHTALVKLAEMLRTSPTLLADPLDPTQHLEAAAKSDCALRLPQTH